MPDVFTALSSIRSRALGLVSPNAFVKLGPPRIALDLGRAVEELVRGWLAGEDLVVEETFPLAAPSALLSALLREFEEVLRTVEEEGVASIELAYAIARCAAALCIAAGARCRSEPAIRRGIAIARTCLEAALRGRKAW